MKKSSSGYDELSYIENFLKIIFIGFKSFFRRNSKKKLSIFIHIDKHIQISIYFLQWKVLEGQKLSLDSQLPTIGISKSTVLWKLTPATKIVSFRNIQTKHFQGEEVGI